ncbi:MAG: hemerythrin domain-containing protein [Rubricoccaceae bacterium]|nr:hemerythrin domain-containing protein [Rubricoccaceae bacterium]
MSWNDGPLQSWYDIHEAIRNDLRHIRAMAGDPTAEAPTSFTENVQFFLDVLTVHSMHEDGVAFPYMQRRGIEIPKRIREEHIREWSAMYDVRVTLMEIHALDEGQGSGPAYERIRTRLETLERDLLAHIEFEDDELIPQCEARLSIDEQKELVTKLVGETPTWIAPHLMWWMFSNVSLEHAAHLLEAWRSVLPHATFLEKAKAIRQGVDAPVWTALKQAVPILSELD